MPITKTGQARIDLSREQYKAIADLWRSAQIHVMSLEETNLENVVAVISTKGTSLIYHNGEVRNLSGKGAT